MKTAISVLLNLLVVVASIVLFTPSELREVVVFQAFAFQFGIASFVLSILIIWKRHWINSIGFVIASLVVIWGIRSSFAPSQTEIKDGIPLKVAHFTMSHVNENYLSAFQQILELDADLVTLDEVNYKWSEELFAALREKYPYYKSNLQICCFGSAIFSKYPVASLYKDYHNSIPILAVNVNIEEQEIFFATSYALSPRNESRFQIRNEQLIWLAKYLKQDEGVSAFISGDFNTVPWDFRLQNFQDSLNMQHSRTKFQATYPTYFHLPVIPIDHIFHTKNIQCLDFRTLYNGGSDHYAIIGEYMISRD